MNQHKAEVVKETLEYCGYNQKNNSMSEKEILESINEDLKANGHQPVPSLKSALQLISKSH
ncbi:hypothetical protein QX776_08315 [Alteromonadaceae bacterium BrNp21-10]|nr:hypothetical protein [Alteromonadaceae bacterium BrNp21-10]